MAKKKKRAPRQKSKKAYKVKLKPATVVSIVQIMFLSLAALVMVSFSRQGLILEKINEYLILFFGWTSIMLPFIFVAFSFLVSKYKIFLSQPNVVVGMLLFFLATTGMTKAGLIGRNSWEGLESLITWVGAFIVFFGTAFVGLIILFNTSLDQVFNLFVSWFKTYGIRGQGSGKKLGNLKQGKLKVIGGPNPSPSATPSFSLNLGASNNSKTPPESKAKEKVDTDLSEKLVSNIPGEDKLWKYPPLSILSDAETGKAQRGDIKGNAATIEETLQSFGIEANVVEVNLGPAVTQYAIQVALGTKLSKITTLERDLALALAAPTGTIRIEAPIPGRSLVGIELPNYAPEFVTLKKMMESEEMKNVKSKLAVALGSDVSGKSIIADLGKMPHVLIAGQTGSGKSVAINTFLCTMLLRSSPAEVKFILVDPKRVELTGYNGIPHLLSPVITDNEKVISALKWLLAEMDRRYHQFSQAGVRNIAGFNEMSGFQALPYIVLIIDELADIMLTSPVEVEDAITRIAQMSRATGIHMVLATQRPSVNVITGLIKANVPTRIAFAVASQVDSRVILDGQGAEKLLGKGDMLYLPPDQAKPMRIQGAFLSDKDINSLLSFLKNQGVPVQYTEEVTSMPAKGSGGSIEGVDGDVDEHFKAAVELVVQYDKASASLLQRRLSVGYARAARIIDQLEAAGVVGPAEGSKPREVLVRNAEEVFNKTSNPEE